MDGKEVGEGFIHSGFIHMSFRIYWHRFWGLLSLLIQDAVSTTPGQASLSAKVSIHKDVMDVFTVH